MYPVLAPLSKCYPRCRGRLPTRYSPVRHSTRDRSPFLVRLACVKHAASVQSEPGSNSPVKYLNKSRKTRYSSTEILISFYKTPRSRSSGFLGPIFYFAHYSVFNDRCAQGLTRSQSWPPSFGERQISRSIPPRQPYFLLFIHQSTKSTVIY